MRSCSAGSRTGASSPGTTDRATEPRAALTAGGRGVSATATGSTPGSSRAFRSTSRTLIVITASARHRSLQEPSADPIEQLSEFIRTGDRVVTSGTVAAGRRTAAGTGRRKMSGMPTAREPRPGGPQPGEPQAGGLRPGELRPRELRELPVPAGAAALTVLPDLRRALSGICASIIAPTTTSAGAAASTGMTRKQPIVRSPAPSHTTPQPTTRRTTVQVLWPGHRP